MPTIEKTTWRGMAAFRLTDGRHDAIVVPGISSRLVRFGPVGGANALWTAPVGKTWKKGEWRNWGGEKVWPSPQSSWDLFAQPSWPPDASWDQAHCTAQVQGEALVATSPTLVGFGVTCRRTFLFEPGGALVVTTIFRKVAGEARQVSVWNVVQIPQPEAVYVRANPESPYTGGFYWFGGKAPREGRVVREGEVLHYRPSLEGGYKAGFDSPGGAIVAVRAGVALRVAATKKSGAAYPEGADGAGFPLTVWNNGGGVAAERYNELELSSPLTALRPGQSLTHTIKLSLHPLLDGGDPAQFLTG